MRPWRARSAQIIVIAFLCILGLEAFTVPLAQAIDCPEDWSSIECIGVRQDGGTNWIPMTGSCSTPAAFLPNGTAKENGQAIFNFFSAEGRLAPYQAAGIIGNMVHESGLMPQRLEGTGPNVITTAEGYLSRGLSSGWGLVQFTPGTKFILSKNPSIRVSDANNLGVQVSFVWDQLEGKTDVPESRAGEDLKATKTIEEAVLAFQGNTRAGGKYYGYERPFDQSGTVAARTDAAKSALQEYGSGAGGTTNTSGSSCSAGSGAARNGFALPVDQSFYDSNPGWFSKPHHDYPAADIPVATGTKVYAVQGGKIIRAPVGGGCGVGVMIDSGNNTEYLYCHGSDGGSVEGAKEGDTVEAGQLIMHSASTGHSTGPHLHLQIRYAGSLVCPQNLLIALGDSSVSIPKIESLPKSGCSY